ncbi:MAG: TonB family protein [Halobacteriovoraceae bacterium]|nr:TonB family protein [Halobacteriovoraceae bacterium]
MQVAVKEINSKKMLYILLSFSFVFHMLITAQSINISSVSLLETTKKEPQAIKIKLLQQALKSKQVVQTEQAKSKKKVESKFYSNKNNAFERETKSANNGKFQAAGKGNRKAIAQKNMQIRKTLEKRKIKKLKFSDLAVMPNQKKYIKKKKKIAKRMQTKKGLKNGMKKGVGLGQTNDFLDDMPLGDFTRLNTQEYEFYGFYHRIRQKLEQFWGLNIQDKADKIFKQGRSIATDSNLVTGLKIMINKNGEIVKININSSSGVKELDDAAIQSFNQAGPFPNPPKGMLKSGIATIEWGFVVNT